MKIFKKLTLLILATSFILSCGPLKKLRTVIQGKVDKTNFIEEIPFEYYNGQIFIDVEISKKKYKFSLKISSSKAQKTPKTLKILKITSKYGEINTILIQNPSKLA